MRKVRKAVGHFEKILPSSWSFSENSSKYANKIENKQTIIATVRLGVKRHLGYSLTKGLVLISFLNNEKIFLKVASSLIVLVFGKS